MKKGTQIMNVKFQSGKVIATAKLKSLTIDLALTRAQRKLFRQYTDRDFLNKVAIEFGNADILSDDFYIEIDGEIVYNRK